MHDNFLVTRLLRLVLSCVGLVTAAEVKAQSKVVYGVGCHGLQLDADELPDWTTAPFDFLVTGIPSGTALTLLLWSADPLPFGIDLGFFGAPGCSAYVDDWLVYDWGLGSVGSFGSTGGAPPLFNSTWWIGREVAYQAATLTPGINGFGHAMSNGLLLVGG